MQRVRLAFVLMMGLGLILLVLVEAALTAPIEGRRGRTRGRLRGLRLRGRRRALAGG